MTDMDAFIARIQRPRTIRDWSLDEQPEREPDPPVYSDAESDRAADLYEAWLDSKASE